MYQEELFPVIHQMKYGPRPTLARFFGELMARAFAPAIIGLALDGVLPVPLHPKRLRQRGFNQASLMAKRMESHTGIPVQEGFMERALWTRPQVGLSRAQREANVRGAFRVRNPRQVRGKRWLLMDDVYTTGSTLRESVRALRQAGASEVHVLVLARVL
jgi:ComF family protein